jgi:hypothetical protein
VGPGPADDRELHFYRRLENGLVDYGDEPHPTNGWNIFRLDSIHSGLFCVGPVIRRERIRREVIILKTLWDISTHIRAERLLHILTFPNGMSVSKPI